MANASSLEKAGRTRARRRLGQLLLKRFGEALPTVLGIVVLNFLLLNSAPGNAVDALVGIMGASDPEFVARMTAQFGLDRSMPERLVIYIGNLFTFNLGNSYYFNRPVADLIFERLGATLLLMLSSIGLAVVVGVTLGITAARYYNTLLDRVIGLIALLLYAMPVFWVGLMLIILFSVKLEWFPMGGASTIGASNEPFYAAVDVLKHLALPMITLSLYFIATYTRLMRASMLETLHKDYIRTARAKGVPERTIAYRHALRNALLPVVTVIGVQMGALLGGSVIVETVFGWPGLGRLAYESVVQRDFNVLLGILFMSSIVVLTVNLLIDLVYAKLDPRIEI